MANLRTSRRVLVCAVAAIATPLAGAGCGGSSSDANPGTVRLGLFPNLTHASALVGLRNGYFTRELGPHTKLKTTTFNAGPDAVTALFSGAVDASYVGPSPAVNAWHQSHGKAVKIVSGAASGGAELVAKRNIASVRQLRGKKVATPQLGNTQDVAARYYLRRHGLRTDTHGGGQVHITPMKNAQVLRSFSTGDVAAAWVPEPYASRLVVHGHGHVLVDERSLWPHGRFVTTQLLVRTDFLREHPRQVTDLLRAQVRANDYLNRHPAAAQAATMAELRSLTGKSDDRKVVRLAFSHIAFTDDPVAPSLRAGARHATSLGLLPSVKLTGIYDLAPLNRVLRARKEPEVHS